MPVLKNIAAIAKGMSITFMEMFQPTIVENYQDRFHDRCPMKM